MIIKTTLKGEQFNIDVNACNVCGSLILNEELHEKFHEKFDLVSKEAHGGYVQGILG